MRADVQPAEAAQQYFPTYKVPPEKQEVTLREYDLSVQALTADQRSISLATGLAVVIISFSGTLLGSENGVSSFTTTLKKIGEFSELALFAIVLCVSLVALRSFAELQRSATYAARKIVVLRRLLGVDYGTVERVMPTDRIEGANEPFAIPLFPGWGSIGPLASMIVAVFAAALFAVSVSIFSEMPRSLSWQLARQFRQTPESLFMLSAATGCGLLLVYRAWLLESWETARFLMGRVVAHELAVPIKPRLGHILYRMELGVYEAQRVGILLEAFFPILLHIEDRRFYAHNGNDWRAVARAIRNRFKYRVSAGGSTLDQQLFRSTCLARLHRTFTRKPVEWMMAPWLRKQYGADQVIRMYLCSVRFDRGIIGIAAAAVHFFDVPLHSRSSWAPSKAQVFFLVERLSNVTRTIPTMRIRALISGLQAATLISHDDIAEIRGIYLEQVGKGLITASLEDLDF
jgi:penicillin-binding protein 1A